MAYPQYLGSQTYHSIPSIYDLQDGYLHLSSVGYSDMKSYLANNEFTTSGKIHFWYHDDDVRTYSPFGSQIELGFNTNKYPLSESWFRRAIAYSIEYAPIATYAADNNWIRGSPTYLNPHNPSHAKYYSPEIHEKYKFDTNPTRAIEILKEHGCYKIGKQWFATVPENGGLWNESYIGKDVNPFKKGTQIKLGPYTIITPTGWIDTTDAVNFWASSIFSNMGILVNKEEIDYSLWIVRLGNLSDFDMCMWTSGPATIKSAYRIFDSLAQPHSTWGNVSSWRGENAYKFVDALHKFETATDDQSRIEFANVMQEAYAADLPTIPSHIHCRWYQYSEYRWKGFLNQAYQYNQQIVQSTVDQTVLKQKLILALIPENDSSWNPPTEFSILTEWPEDRLPFSGDLKYTPGKPIKSNTISWSYFPIVSIFGVVGVMFTLTKIKLKKREIKNTEAYQ